MTRRLALAGLVLALVAAACGDDDAATTTIAAPTTTAATTTTTTAAATTTTAAATTTAPPSTTTTQGVDPEVASRIALASALAGDWEGEWRNTTFGSVGPIVATLTANADAGFVIANVDLGGFVFGAEDPDPMTVEFDLIAGPPYDQTSGLLGATQTVLAADGSFTVTAPDVPGDRIASMVIEGQLGPDSLVAQYTIGFEGGGDPALGEIEVSKTG